MCIYVVVSRLENNTLCIQGILIIITFDDLSQLHA